jgi:AcrR family transcriptional regulator
MHGYGGSARNLPAVYRALCPRVIYGPYVPAISADRDPATEEMRQAVLNAVRALLMERGWSRTTISDVAMGAGVSRQEIYEEFGTRQGLAEAYVARDVTRMITVLEAGIRDQREEPFVAVRLALETFLKLASGEPVIQIIVAGVDEGGLLGLLTSLGRAIAAERLTVVFQEIWPNVRDVDARLFADTVVRLAISHAVIPTGPVREAAEGAARVLEPFLQQILSRPSAVGY